MDIGESLDRILKQTAILASQLYSLFLERYPEVRPHFAGVNLQRQALMLTSALMMVERHHAGSYPAAKMFLKYLGTKHHDRGVLPELYPKFRDALLETLQRFHGEEWDSHLATQWGAAFDRTVETMHEGYREHLHV